MNGYTRFGTYLREPQFNDLYGLQNAMDELPAAVKIGDDSYAQPEAFKAIVDRADRTRVFGFASKEFKLLQHREALQPAVDGIRDMNLQFRGSFLGYEPGAWNNSDSAARETSTNGQMNALLIFEDPAFEFQLLKDYGEPFKIGLRLSNGLIPGQSLSATAFGVNMICCNYGLWGNVINAARSRHIGSMEKGLADFRAAVQAAMNGAAAIPGIVQKAFEIQVEPARLGDILLGIDLPQRAAKKIADDVRPYLVGVQKDQLADKGLNLKLAYDSVTNFYTHQYEGSLSRAEWAVNNATDLLTVDLPKLLERADARKQREVEAKARA